MPDRHTIRYLESVIAAWKIRKCEECGEYETPSKSDGVGGIQADDIGTDSKGRTVHAKCVVIRSR